MDIEFDNASLSTKYRIGNNATIKFMRIKAYTGYFFKTNFFQGNTSSRAIVNSEDKIVKKISISESVESAPITENNTKRIEAEQIAIDAIPKRTKIKPFIAQLVFCQKAFSLSTGDCAFCIKDI